MSWTPPQDDEPQGDVRERGLSSHWRVTITIIVMIVAVLYVWSMLR